MVFRGQAPDHKALGRYLGRAQAAGHSLILARTRAIYREKTKGKITSHEGRGVNLATTFPHPNGKQWVSRERQMSGKKFKRPNGFRR